LVRGLKLSLLFQNNHLLTRNYCQARQGIISCYRFNEMTDSLLLLVL